MNAPVLIDSSLELSERVATLTFQRDDVRNALTGTGLIADIVNTVNWANQSSEVSVLVLTGQGSAFSAGGNVKDMVEKRDLFAGSDLEIQDQYRRQIQQIPLTLQKAEVPLIAAINGHAIGAGLDLACMCDLRIASERARFGETFIDLGVIPGDGGIWFLQRMVGYQRAAELILTGRLIDANEALNLGLLLEIVGPDELASRVRSLALQIAAKPPKALRLTKRLMARAQREELQDFLEICACFQGMAHHTEEHRLAVNAFLKKLNDRQ